VAADATVNELGGLSGQVAADIGGGQLRPPHDRGIHDGDLAHARAPDRARRPLPAREAELRRILQDKVELEWSPAQIAPHLRAVQRRPHFVRVVIRQIENERRRTGAHHPEGPTRSREGGQTTPPARRTPTASRDAAPA
jgi:IS30 family transposase